MEQHLRSISWKVSKSFSFVRFFFSTTLLIIVRLRSVEQAIGLMKNLQTSIVVEESWVEKQTEKLQSLPTATSARELDVSTKIVLQTAFYCWRKQRRRRNLVNKTKSPETTTMMNEWMKSSASVKLCKVYRLTPTMFYTPKPKLQNLV